MTEITFEPATEQIHNEPITPATDNTLIKLFVRIQPDVNEQGTPIMDRLVVNGKRKSIPIFFRDEDSYYKDKIFESEEENGTMQVRMQSLNEPSYAFKIRLYDKAGQFFGQSKINIDKFLEDPYVYVTN